MKMKMAVRMGQNGHATIANGIDDNGRRDRATVPLAIASSVDETSMMQSKGSKEEQTQEKIPSGVSGRSARSIGRQLTNRLAKKKHANITCCFKDCQFLLSG